MFRIVSESNVYATDKQGWTCAGSRSAVLPDGNLICVFNGESNEGVNDFYPLISYSKDGETWSEAKPLWADWQDRISMFLNVRNTADGRISVCGMATPIDVPGENWWNNEQAAMKANRLVYAISEDGYTFPEPSFITLPFPGSCEIPGGMQVDRDGTMTIVYSPYHSIDEKEPSDINCLVLVRSTDGGKTWTGQKIGVVDGPCQYAETWIDRLSTGAMMVSTWQTASTEASDQYLYSPDGNTFSGPFPLPFRGQSTALTAWKDGKVLIVYNQRKENPVGVWLAVAQPDESGFHMIENIPVWKAATATRGTEDRDFTSWTSFSFGEPHILPLPNGEFLVVLWFSQDGVTGIRAVRLALED